MTRVREHGIFGDGSTEDGPNRVPERVDAVSRAGGQGNRRRATGERGPPPAEDRPCWQRRWFSRHRATRAHPAPPARPPEAPDPRRARRPRHRPRAAAARARRTPSASMSSPAFRTPAVSISVTGIPCQIDGLLEGVPRRAGNRRDDRAVSPQQPIEKCRFSDTCRTGQRHPGALPDDASAPRLVPRAPGPSQGLSPLRRPGRPRGGGSRLRRRTRSRPRRVPSARPGPP